METERRTALVAGATGLIGSHLVDDLLKEDSYIRVILLTRSGTNKQQEKIEEKIINFDRLDNELKGLKADDVYCCLGTTMKQAGSKEAFRKVDYEYVVKLAEEMQKNGTSRFLVVSSMGADPGSSFFYNRVKGDMEMAVKNIPYPSINIFRPSLLEGNRKEQRAMEKIVIFLFKIFKFIMVGSLRQYRIIEASVVASAMVKIALSWGEGIFTYESEMIRKI